MQLNLIQLFPELLNLSGDRGNITVLKKRCRLREITLSVKSVSYEEDLDFTDIDILYLGGGSEKDLPRIAQKLNQSRTTLLSFREKGGVLLAVGSSYPLLGKEFPAMGNTHSGLHLMEITTCDSDSRFTGTVSVNTPFGVLAGFENHTAKTSLSTSVTPLGTVLSGFGNNGEDRTEGAVYKNIYGTYLTGPLLPNNPELSDLLIQKAIEQKYKTFPDLAPLPCELENLAKGYLLNYGNRTHKR